MALRKSIVALVVAAVLSASVSQSKACIALPPPPAAIPGTAVSAGAWAAGGIIAVAAALCLYDIWLKINGYKNWDGSPKVVQIVHHHHR